MHCKFAVDVPSPDDLEATGSLFDYEYTFERSGRTVATVSKEFFSWSDSYEVDIADGGATYSDPGEHRRDRLMLPRRPFQVRPIGKSFSPRALLL